MSDRETAHAVASVMFDLMVKTDLVAESSYRKYAERMQTLVDLLRDGCDHDWRRRFDIRSDVLLFQCESCRATKWSHPK